MSLCLNIFSIGQPARGPQKTFNSKRGPQPKKFGNRCLKTSLIAWIYNKVQWSTC